MTAAQILRAVYRYVCPACLDFGHLDGIGPCPECRADAYAEHIAGWLELGVAA